MTLPLAAPLAPMLAKSVPTVPGPDAAGGPFARLLARGDFTTPAAAGADTALVMAD